MQHIYTKLDREPLTDQYMRVTRWDDTGLYEIAIHYSNARSQTPDRKIARISLTDADMEELAFCINASLEDRKRQEGSE